MILDIGNLGGVEGAGISNSFHIDLRAKVEPESTVYGMDLFEPREDDRELFKNQIRANIEDSLPFESASFDTVYMGQVLEHLRNSLAALGEVRRILKNDGVFICDVPNPYSFYRILRYALSRRESLGDPTHICMFTPASLMKLLDLSGFSIRELATDWKQRTPWLPKTWRIGLGPHLLAASVPRPDP